MVQATVQGGSQLLLWKRQFVTDNFQQRSEYLEPSSDEALLDSIDPSLAHKSPQLSKRPRLSQIETIFDQLDTPTRRTFVSDERHIKVSAELIAERFGNGPTQAQPTLRVTTQRGMRSAILPISRRYCADRIFNVKRLHGKFATDTAYGKLQSLRGNVGCHIQSKRLILLMVGCPGYHHFCTYQHTREPCRLFYETITCEQRDLLVWLLDLLKCVSISAPPLATVFEGTK